MTQSLEITLGSLLGIKGEESQSEFLKAHSPQEIDALLKRADMLNNYAEILSLPLEEVKDLSKEDLDARASVRYQNSGDLLIGFGFIGCGGTGAGMGLVLDQFVDTAPGPSMALSLGIVGAVVWGTISTIGALGDYSKAFKHYRLLSPEKKSEIGMPLPGRMYTRGANHLISSSAKDVSQGVNRGLEQARKGIDYVRSGQLKEYIRGQAHKGVDYVRSGELKADVIDKIKRDFGIK